MVFTRPLDPEKLAVAGIVPRCDDSLVKHSPSSTPFSLRGRMGRGGRIVFDRWNPLLLSPVELGNSFYMPPKPRHAVQN